MDPFKFTTIAHAPHRFCAPVSVAGFDRLAAQAGLRPGDRVLDVGCGKAAMLIRLIQQYGIVGLGVDVNADFLETGRANATALGLGPDRLQLRCQPAAEFLAESSRFDMALCIGATHALGNFRGTLEKLPSVLRPAGHALLGEGCWQQPPHPDYLAFLGARSTDYETHAGNCAVAEHAGWQVVDTVSSSLADWDDYEDHYAASVETWAAAHPADPDTPALLARIRGWRDAYLRHGRATLGFALYLLHRPA